MNTCDENIYLSKYVGTYLDDLNSLQKNAEELRGIFNKSIKQKVISQDIRQFIEFLQQKQREIELIQAQTNQDERSEKFQQALETINTQKFFYETMKQKIVFGIEKWRDQLQENNKQKNSFIETEKKEFLDKRISRVEDDIEISYENRKLKKIKSSDQKKSQGSNKPQERTIQYGKIKKFSFQTLINEKSECLDDKCFYCQKSKDEILGDLFIVTQGGKKLTFHDCCSLWTNELYFKGKQNIFSFPQIQQSFEKSSQNSCQICQSNFASLKCSLPDCLNYYHFPCFMQSSEGVITNQSRFEFKCSQCYVQKVTSTVDRGKNFLSKMIQDFYLKLEQT